MVSMLWSIKNNCYQIFYLQFCLCQRQAVVNENLAKMCCTFYQHMGCDIFICIGFTAKMWLVIKLGAGAGVGALLGVLFKTNKISNAGSCTSTE